jgi:Domain of unknown function (DUF4440)
MRSAPRLAACVLTLSLLAACGGPRDTVRVTIDRMAKAAHARDADALMRLLTPDFQAGDGSSRAETEALVRRLFAAYEILDVSVSDVTVERGGNVARARFRTKLSGQPRRVGGLDGLLPSSATTDFDVRLVRDGSSWKVTWASWNPASDR